MNDISPLQNWFPGLNTGPRVAVPISADEISSLHRMLAPAMNDHHNRYAEIRDVLRDLDVRAGAIHELKGGQFNPAETCVPMDFHQCRELRAAVDQFYRCYGRPMPDLLERILRGLDQRLGAAQVQRVGAGNLTPDEMPLRGGDPYGDDH